MATWDVTYRRLGHDGAGWPGTFLDVGAAVDHLRVLAEDYPLDLDRIVLFGHSAGAPLAVWAGARRALPGTSEVRGPNPLRLHAAIAIDGPLDLAAWNREGFDETVCGEPVIAELMGGTPNEVPERYRDGSPVEMPAFEIDIHGLPAGLMDRFVGHDAMQTRAEQRGERLHLRPVPESNHFQLITPEHPAWPPVRAAILEALGASLGARAFERAPVGTHVGPLQARRFLVDEPPFISPSDRDRAHRSSPTVPARSGCCRWN